jgi:hypothetical protein
LVDGRVVDPGAPDGEAFERGGSGQQAQVVALGAAVVEVDLDNLAGVVASDDSALGLHPAGEFVDSDGRRLGIVTIGPTRGKNGREN